MAVTVGKKETELKGRLIQSIVENVSSLEFLFRIIFELILRITSVPCPNVQSDVYINNEHGIIHVFCLL